jgi:hypothetical protein
MVYQRTPTDSVSAPSLQHSCCSQRDSRPNFSRSLR